MFRVVAYLIAGVLVIGIVRSIIGIILKGFADLFQSDDSHSSRPGRRPPTIPAGGQLKKDPVCGTFISAATALQKKSGGETYYFCSEDCRAKFRG